MFKEEIMNISTKLMWDYNPKKEKKKNVSSTRSNFSDTR